MPCPHEDKKNAKPRIWNLPLRDHVGHATRRSPGRVPCPIMGKLTTVANRIVDRGELCLPGEGASLSEHSVVLIRPDAPGSRGRQVLGQFVPEPA